MHLLCRKTDRNCRSGKPLIAAFAGIALAIGFALASPPSADAQSPRIRLSRPSLPFGRVEVEHTKTLPLVIQNSGKAELDGDVSALSAPFAVTFNGGTFAIPPGGKLPVEVAFAPQATGAATPQTLTITSNDPNHASIALNVTGAGHATIAVSSISDTSPTPLTPITLTTAGLRAGPLSVTFFNSAGFLATVKPIRVRRGVVTVAVPLYVDPTTKGITSGQVSLFVSQRHGASVPALLDIQDLPPLSAYGTQLGQITHAFLVFETMVLGRRLNQLQALQPLLPAVGLLLVHNLVAQNTLNVLLQAAILARGEVDSVLQNNSTVVSWGNLPDGTPIQFDQTQLDIMDRIIAVYLTQQFSGLLAPSGAAPHAMDRTANAVATSTSLSTIITDALSMMQDHEGVPVLIDYVQGNANSTDAQIAALDGVEPVLENSGWEKTAGLVGLASSFGHLAQAVDSINHDIGESAACLASPSCTTQQADELQAELQSHGVEFVSADISAISKVPAMAGLELEAQSASSVSQLFDSLAWITGLAGSGEVNSADQLDAKLAKKPQLKDLGVVSGVATISNSQGIAAAQTSLDLCCFGASALGIVGVADPGGNYDLYVPMNVPGTDYSNMTLDAVDPFSGIVLGTETVDLTGLSTSTPVQVPTVTGTCTDTDSALDADDPDCD
jgi:Abnormal spindle-like microcephaly-assoc'd, ASPM-SPD-2-Hydin